MSLEKGSTRAHQNLVKSFPVAVCREFNDVVVLPYTNGVFRDFDSAERIIHAGQKGVVDILVLGCGYYVWFDGKTGMARFTKEQTAFKERLKQINNGVEHVYKLTSIEQGLDVLRQVRKIYASNI